MEFELDKAISILDRTPTLLEVYLKDLSPEWTHKNEGEHTWSAYDILGHLIHGEKTDWIPRAKIILGENREKTFVPFDRFAQFENSQGKSIDELLSEFKTLRSKNTRTLRQMELSANQLRKIGVHPEFGNVTLSSY